MRTVTRLRKLARKRALPIRGPEHYYVQPMNHRQRKSFNRTIAGAKDGRFILNAAKAHLPEHRHP